MRTNFEELKKTLGPGILFASTCVGVSHLVQSTRAGADYGFILLIAIVLANLFKYPFYEFASRYTSATGNSILEGYNKVSRSVLLAYTIMTFITMFIVAAAVVFVTAGLLSNLFPDQLSTDVWGAIILIFCSLLLIIGKYGALDSLLKVVGTVLVISVLVAFVSAVIHGPAPRSADFIPKEIGSATGLMFAVALMGWMPSGVDMSTWNSLWTEARIKQTNYHPTLKQTLLDFNLGYIVSAVLAILFLSLGTLIIYGTGTELSNSSPAFAHQLISMFTTAIGDWSYYVIAVAAFSTMFSTSITVIDGYCRAISRSYKLLFHSHRKDDSRSVFVLTAVILCIGTYAIISQFLNNLKMLVDFATVVSFIIAPLAAYFNYRAIYSKEVSTPFRPPSWLRKLAHIGLTFLSLFALGYLIVLFYSKF